MTNQADSNDGNSRIDPERVTDKNEFDNATGYSGQEHTPEREAAMGRDNPSGHSLIGEPRIPSPASGDPSGADIPPDAGRRAWFDPKTGAVHGSGSGAGGGNDGEDYDEGTPGGA